MSSDKAAPAAPSADDEDDWGDEEEPEETSFQLSLEVGTSKEVEAGGTCNVMVSIKVPEHESSVGDSKPAADGPPSLKRTKSGRVDRPPTDVCCVVDISGSMCSAAKYEVDGVQKDDGLSYLDIVKHAVKTVANILRDHDRLTIIAFDNTAEVVYPLTYMTEEERTKAVDNLEALAPRGRTNLWEGIRTGMEALRTPTKDAGWRQKSILLLTDGVPNEVPPEGHIAALRKYKECHPDFSFQLNTFGFGYSLESDLLLDLAVEGHGTFAFIPDALIVGTCFVSSVANALSTQNQNATLHLMTSGGSEFTGPVVGFSGDLVGEASWGRFVSLGPLQFGTSREVVVPMKIPPGTEPYLEAVLEYPRPDGGKVRVAAKGCSRALSKEAIAATARAEAVTTVFASITETQSSRDHKAAQDAMEALVKAVEGYEADSSPNTFVPDLKADMAGRATKAFQGLDRFNRWGKHYLRALTRAHQIQINTNNMDRGLQHYGGTLFNAIREEGSAIFIGLPAPKPSRRTSSGGGGGGGGSTSGGGSASRAQSPDMNTYMAGPGGG